MATSPGSAALRVVQVTDVYTLENFPSLKTLLAEQRVEAAQSGTKLISVLTGDFLAPYLLSSVDHGRGIMGMLNSTPIDYLTWGNHDINDMPHKAVLEREKEYKGVWINSNMTSHESFTGSPCQTDAAVVEVCSRDGSHKRRVGMCAVLSAEPGLYRRGVGGGCKIEDPWETLKTYKAKLEGEHQVDLVLPLCHLYEHQDERTCREFDFPVVLSGHDHHCVDRVIEGSRLLKPGQDCRCAVILDIVWDVPGAGQPRISARTINVTDYKADELLLKEVRQAYSVLDKLKGTQLAAVPRELRPFTSFGSRDRRVTAGTFLCNSIRDALNAHGSEGTPHCDSGILKGGNVRGGKDYAEKEHFSYESLMSETQEEHVVHIFQVPGRCLRVGLRETWGKPSPGWMQYSDDIVVDGEGYVTAIAGAPLDEARHYRIASMKDLARVDDGPTIASHFAGDPSLLPDFDAGNPLRALLLGYFAGLAWAKIWEALDVDKDGQISAQELKRLDTDGDGTLDRQELLQLLRDVAGLAAAEGETSFVDVVLQTAGDTGDHRLNLQELNAQRPRESEAEEQAVPAAACCALW